MNQNLSPEDRELALEHRNAILDIQAVIGTENGRRFFKYLFKSLDVGEVPVFGLTDEFLHDRLGFLRAGNSIWKIACEANCVIAGKILAEIEKEKYEKLIQDARTGQG